MKQYKLIKQYPTSPEIGFIINFQNNGNDIINPTKYPEFWEQVFNPNYKILQMKAPSGIVLTFSDNICIHRTDNSSLDKSWTLNKCLESKASLIYKIERFSDGKMFTIGDTIFPEDNTFNKITIDKFEQKGKELWLCDKDTSMCTLKVANKIDNVTFTTEDGVLLTEKDKFWVVRQDTCNLVGNRSYSFPDFSKDKTKYLRFSSLETANHYRIHNKSCLSLQDILSTVNLGLGAGDRLKELTKSKIL